MSAASAMTSDDNLYRIAPPNATFRLNYAADSWSAAVESVIYAEQNEVSETNAEQKTSGYGIVNLRRYLAGHQSCNWRRV